MAWTEKIPTFAVGKLPVSVLSSVGFCFSLLFCVPCALLRLFSRGIPMVYIGIDSGTQSTKSIVVDAETGEILASAQRKYDLIPNLPPAHMEQDPQEWIDPTHAPVQDGIKKILNRSIQIAAN